MSPSDAYRARGVELDVQTSGAATTELVLGGGAATEGPPGPTGPAGPPGAPGLDGMDGTDGEDGTVAVYEQPDDPGDVPLGSIWIDTDSVVGEEE